MLAPMRVALALALVAIALVTGARAQEPAALTDATVVEREGFVEVWVRLTRPSRYQAELIDSPHRLVLDFADTAYRWTSKPVPVAPEPVRELRGSQFKKGVARLVVELRRPAAYTIERDREGLRIIFARDRAAGELAPRPAPRRGSTQPLVYGIVMLDAEAHAYIFDPALRQVRRYRVGDTVGDAVIETIGERHVVLKTPTGRVELRVDESKPR
jgi:AMIN domain-containing protein